VDFQCLRCGNCCRHPGAVRLQEGESETIATALGVDVHSFTESFTVLMENRQGLILHERPDGACVFLDDPGATCRIQAAKPRQCREFPARWRYTNLEEICPAARRGGSTSDK
jgi:Fe-S-cluster containining protein